MANLFVVARTGWMKRYADHQAGDDRVIGNARFLKEGNSGAERFNFLDIDGYLYGYFRPSRKEVIKLEKIQPGYSGDKLDGVTFILVEKSLNGGQHVLGWYRNATLYRYPQKTKSKARQDTAFFAKASTKDAVLIPATLRAHQVPHGKRAMGQSGICYSHDNGGKPRAFPWMRDLLTFIDGYRGENLAGQPPEYFGPEAEEVIQSSSADFTVGFEPNPNIRTAIDDYALRHATRYFLKKGYKVIKLGKPYDLKCERRSEELHVEVKGTRGSGEKIWLTAGEVSHAGRHRPTALYVLHHVRLIGNGNGKAVKLRGGKRHCIYPWRIGDGLLKPIQYAYTLPQRE